MEAEPIERKCDFLFDHDKRQFCNRIALSSESRIWSIVSVSIRRFWTDEFSTYRPASHGFTIGRGRLKLTYLRRAGDFASKKTFNRIKGPLEAIKCENIPVANRISIKNPMGGDVSTYIPASHGFTIDLGWSNPTFLKRKVDILSENNEKNVESN